MTEDVGSILWLGRSPGEGNSYPLQYSGLENSVVRGAWRATVHGVAKESDITERLNNNNKLASLVTLSFQFKLETISIIYKFAIRTY